MLVSVGCVACADRREAACFGDRAVDVVAAAVEHSERLVVEAGAASDPFTPSLRRLSVPARPTSRQSAGAWAENRSGPVATGPENARGRRGKAHGPWLGMCSAGGRSARKLPAGAVAQRGGSAEAGGEQAQESPGERSAYEDREHGAPIDTISVVLKPVCGHADDRICAEFRMCLQAVAEFVSDQRGVPWPASGLEVQVTVEARTRSALGGVALATARQRSRPSTAAAARTAPSSLPTRRSHRIVERRLGSARAGRSALRTVGTPTVSG